MKPRQASWVSIAFFFLLLAASPATAQVPLQINYQGMLTDADGLPVEDGSYAMTFAIYDVASGGTALWSEMQTVPVVGGVYNVVLGQPGNEIDPADMDGQRYLGVHVGGDDEMIPRQPITATALALRSAVSDDADTLDGLDATDFAASSHTHSAAEITSGTLNTGYYSAFIDLGVEGFLGNSAGDIAVNNGTRQVNLNADLLDGLNSSAFMAAGTDNWVDESGDTMTGALSVPYLQIDGVAAFVASSSNTFVGFGAGQADQSGFNTYIGYHAGYENTVGFRNTFLGHNSGRDNIQGYDNTFVGFAAGSSTVDGSVNVFVGTSAGIRNTSGFNNTFIGPYVGNRNTTGSYNTFLGRDAGFYNTTGAYNTFLGNNTGVENTTGSENTFIGYNAGKSNTTGIFNTFIGNNAGQSNTGSINTFVGWGAGRANTSGSANTFVGYVSGTATTTGDSNTFLGHMSGQNNLTGVENTFLGQRAGYSNNSGSYNTMIGRMTGHNATGNSNVFIGYRAGFDEPGSNKLYVDNSDTSDPLIWGDFSTNVAAINGRLGVGTQPGSAYQFHSLDERTTGRAVYAEATGADGIGAWGRALGNGGIGIYGTGTGSGAYFKDASASGLAYVGYGDRGIWAKGDFAGGTFSSTDNTTYWADVSTSTHKIVGTGTVSFVQNHPYDEHTVIVYAAPEGDEVAVYTRGTARLVDGEARVTLGETFQYVANPDVGLTAHLTPRGDSPVPLSVASLTTSEMIVYGPTGNNAAFDYLVYGLRLGFEEAAVLQPKQRDALLPTAEAIEEGYGDRPDLRAFNAMTRYQEMRTAIYPETEIDLSQTRELVSALEDQRSTASARAAARQEGMQANRETDRKKPLQPSLTGQDGVASTESNTSDALSVRALIEELRTEIDDLRSKIAAIEAGK